MNIGTKFGVLKDIVTSKVARQVLVTQKHSPTILFGVGVVGVVSTAVLASKATLQLEDVLTEHQRQMSRIHHAAENLDAYTEQTAKSDIVLQYTKTAVEMLKLYGPTIVVGGATLLAFTGSHRILTARNLALGAAYKAVEGAFAEYRQRVVQELGEDKDREFRYATETREVIEETETGPQPREMTTVDSNKGLSGYARFFDEMNINWSPSAMHNKVFLQAQEKWANDYLRSHGHLFLNDVYKALGMEPSPEGQIVGWLYGGKGKDQFVDFGIFRGDSPAVREFVNGREHSILLDFNVDGPIWNLI